MTLIGIIEDIAKHAVLCDAEDLPSLVRLQEQFQELREQVDAEELAVLAHAATQAESLIEQLVFRSVDDADAALEQIGSIVEYAQGIVEAIDAGRDVESVRSPFDAGDEPDAAPIDPDLLQSWLGNCEHALADLEGSLLEIESSDDPAEAIADAKRRIHTLKGECGVLSLHTAQRLCHDVESAIQETIDAGEPFPVNASLALLDWMKAYAEALGGDPAAAPPQIPAVLSNRDETAAADAPVEAGTATGCAAAPTDADTAAAVEEAGDDEPVAFPGELGMDENLNDFLCEAREHISGAEEALLELEQDTEDPELVNTVFRAFHTIKGVAGFMNLQPIVQVAHSAEYLLDQARSGNIQLTSAYLELCLNSCDMLTQLIESLGEGEPPSRREHAELLDRLCRASSGELESPPPPPAGSYPPLGQILVDMHIASPEQIERAIAQQRSNADELTRVLREAGVSNEQQVLEEIVNETGTGKLVHDMLIAIELISRADLDKAINAARGSGKRLGELLGLQANELAPALREQRRHRRAATDRTEAEAESTNAMPPAAAAPATTAPPPTAGATPGAGGKPGEKARRRVDQTVKVSTSRMDSLIDMVGELVIAQQMIVQDPSIRAITEQRLQRNLSQSGKIIRDLQEVAMSLRMVTVRGTFQRMARLVRDLGVKAGKKINFHTEGEDTELDRNVVEEIGDPLVHMIRNACDHGLETPEERRAAGKDEEGNLTLRAYHQGGAIVIEIADDGRGIDRDVILRKAMERGVLAPDRDPAEIPDTEVFNLIFMPGFSTAKEVTDISGRGVGMDVVRRNIENLRGRVEIRSKKGRGSTFVMRLPLTMAIIDGMVVRVGSERYVLPTLAIEQSFRPTADQLSTLTGRGEMVMARGALLPIHRLKRVFQRPDGIDNPTDALLIILDVNDHRCCIMVDEILGEQQVVIKSIGQGIGSIRGVSGAAILGDGHVALILDPANLVVEATSMKLAA